MKPNEIDNLEAGRELDALIAEKVMGYKHYKTRNPFDCSDEEIHDMVETGGDGVLTNVEELPHYSTDISCAYLVLNEFKTVYIWWNDSGSMWQVWLDRKRMVQEDCRGSACDDSDIKDEPNLALAICRAALKSVVL